MSAREGIAGCRTDRITRRNNSDIPDPGTIGADTEFDQRNGSRNDGITGQDVIALLLVNSPVDKDRYQEKIGDGKIGQPLEKRRQSIVDRNTESLQE